MWNDRANDEPLERLVLDASNGLERYSTPSGNRARLGTDKGVEVFQRIHPPQMCHYEGPTPCCLINRAHRKVPERSASLPHNEDTIAALFLDIGLVAVAGDSERSGEVPATASACPLSIA